ncbi:hypothetical protein E2P81_ATG07387 [Venturia nashicola]|uniref:Uncharacterized protein n=1 Tax=Venturia nashicola TaxID=86259 RepID=A0A4Z1NZ25_9PEZI|nr:hypothetical protein E6O75_ATG07542 [Venturia nashicola]TLD31897.1 hypothetical protein E2P81_ATG07387 [Venturia nashicola]
MAPRIRTRTRNTIRPSYREDDSEDEELQELQELQELEELEEDKSDYAAPSRKRKKTTSLSSSARGRSIPSIPAVRTRRQPQMNYAEDLSADEASDDDFDHHVMELEDAVEPFSSPKAKRPRVAKRDVKEKVVRSPRRAPPRRERRRDRSSSLPAPLPARTRQAAPRVIIEVIPFVSDNRIPAWTTLPYEVLQTIFLYASFPLFDDQNGPTPAISWLLKAAQTHKAFFEPAMAALYKCPPLVTLTKPHDIQALLSQDPSSHTINYNVKVKRLELEHQILMYSAGKDYGAFDLGTLIGHLPQLTEIDIWSIYDTPSVRRVGHTKKPWAYPESLFNALVEGGQRLKGFHWNATFLPKLGDNPTTLFQWMHEKLLLTPFQSLKSLALTNFFGDISDRLDLEDRIIQSKPLTTTQVDKEALREEKRQTVKKQDEAFARAICALPELKTLDLHMCTVVDSEWLQLLPTTLTNLGFTSCDRLTSDGLQAFLTSHGSNLKELVLNHNSALSMSFLTTLKETCPYLENFEMDLTYHSKFVSTNSAEPEYENLLLPDEVPTWPKTLQSINMQHLRQWSSASAEIFLNSLINSAEELPDLRHLDLSISLSISWRDRARIRDQWEDKLKRVFLRKSLPPNGHWMSLRGFREWKMRQGAKVMSCVEIPSTSTSTSSSPEETGRPSPIEPESPKKPAIGKRKLRPRKSTSDEESSAQPGLDTSLRDMMMEALEAHVQGMCDVVDIRIDNLRPTENQMHESDFLDSEPSGDEDWDEGRGDPGEDELFGAKSRGKKGRGRSGYAW